MTKIKKHIVEVDDLLKAVDNDVANHTIKDLAELFLQAMNDWPTFNQKRIEDFLIELKEYFGSPLTLEKIANKKLTIITEHDTWRQESGSLICEMIELSTRLENESDFDKILKKILDYYNANGIYNIRQA